MFEISNDNVSLRFTHSQKPLKVNIHVVGVVNGVINYLTYVYRRGEVIVYLTTVVISE